MFVKDLPEAARHLTFPGTKFTVGHLLRAYPHLTLADLLRSFMGGNMDLYEFTYSKNCGVQDRGYFWCINVVAPLAAVVPDYMNWTNEDGVPIFVDLPLLFVRNAKDRSLCQKLYREHLHFLEKQQQEQPHPSIKIEFDFEMVKVEDTKEEGNSEPYFMFPHVRTLVKDFPQAIRELTIPGTAFTVSQLLQAYPNLILQDLAFSFAAGNIPLLNHLRNTVPRRQVGYHWCLKAVVPLVAVVPDYLTHTNVVHDSIFGLSLGRFLKCPKLRLFGQKLHEEHLQALNTLPSP